MLWVCWILLFGISAAIAWQDFKTRLIHLWLIFFFIIINITHYLLSAGYYQLIENAFFCFLYFLFSYAVLQLFYFIKTKKFQKLADNKIGWADILLLFSIGVCIEPINLIYFFTVTFIISVIVQLLFFKKNKSVPLAGFLVISYFLYILSFKIINGHGI